MIRLGTDRQALLERSRWPAGRLGEALATLVRFSGMPARGVEPPNSPPETARENPAETGRWIEAAGALLGVDVEPVVLLYPDAAERLRHAGAAVLRLPEGEFLLSLGRGRLLGPDLAVRRISPGALRSALYRHVEEPLAAVVDRTLADAGVTGSRCALARTALLGEMLRDAHLENCWLLRLPPGSGFWRQLRQAGLPRRVLALGGAHLFQYGLWILSWWMIGQGALSGRLDAGWLLAWALVLLTLVPFRVVTTWLKGQVAITAGGLLKERLLAGALRLHPDEVRHQGVGQFLGRVIESEALESLALSGGFLALMAVIELMVAAAVLAAGAGGAFHLVLLAGWVTLIVILGLRYYARHRRWSDARLDLTDDLVERMAGHRTRLAQESSERWHAGEDQSLERYWTVSAALDFTKASLAAVAPRGWLVLAVAGLAPAFVSGEASTASLAIGIGGSLLAFRAFRRLASGFAYLVDAAIAWRQLAPLFRAAARPETHGSAAFPLGEQRSAHTLVDAHELFFSYRNAGYAVLRGCNLSISAGERVVLEGPSGGGKSTLVSLITGLRHPQSGVLLIGGLDRHTLGPWGWRRLVAAAPQFHENHVLTGPFAFNLLLGRQSLIGPKDIAEAETVCRELGLGELLDRMPAGLLQLVGETGWQLSHGERSRLYIARALLQGSDLVVLDESFAALDPENLHRAVECVARRARTVLAIAHR